jgi:ketosteroid isomerase-like protein
MPSLEQRIQTLEDVEAIKRLKAQYCAFCDDAYDPDGITSLFTEDGVWDGGFMGRFEGRAAIREHFAGTSAIMGFAIHHVTNPLIDVSGDTATAQWYLWQPCTQTTRRTRAIWLAARYDDTCVRTENGWRFEAMIINPRMFAPYEEGWAEVPFLAGGPR